MATVSERLAEIEERLDRAAEQMDTGRAVGDLCIALANALEVLRMQQIELDCMHALQAQASAAA